MGKGVAKLVRKLEAVLRPISIASRKSDRDPPGWSPFKIGPRMIGAVRELDTRKLNVRAVPRQFASGGLHHGGDVGPAGAAKPRPMNHDIRKTLWRGNVIRLHRGATYRERKQAR